MKRPKVIILLLSSASLLLVVSFVRNYDTADPALKVTDSVPKTGQEPAAVQDNVLTLGDIVEQGQFMNDLDLEYERNLSTKGGPMDYLPEYQNPCWMSSYLNPKKGVNPYKEIKRYLWGNDWDHYSETFIKNITARLSQGHNWRVRCTPGLYLIGSSKSGTSDLYVKMVSLHPDIQKAPVKEPQWWRLGRLDKPWARAPYKDYLDGFDQSGELMRQKTVTRNGKPYHPGYASNKGLEEPKYLMAHAIKALHPNTKILAIVREPGARLYSHYRMKFEHEPPEHFDRLIRKDVADWKECLAKNSLRFCAYRPLDGPQAHYKPGVYVTASLYYPYLRDWIDVMGAENVKIIRAEDYYSDRVSSLQDIFKFLKLDPMTSEAIATVTNSSISNSKTSWKRSTTPMLNSTKVVLDAFFRPFNAQLAELLQDERFLWKGY